MFETELETFEAHRPQWLDEGRAGQHVAILGKCVLRFFDDVEDAMQFVIDEHPDDKVLVREIREVDAVHVVQRVHWGARDEEKKT